MTESKITPVCILLRDGKLFGPFKDQKAAIKWCNINSYRGFSTYDLRKP